MAFESGIDTGTIGRLLEQFAEAGKAYYENGVVWVVNMRRLQFPTMIDGSREWQTAVRVAKDIDAIPDCCSLKVKCVEHSGYPIVATSTENDRTIRTVSIGYQYPINTPSIYITKQNITKRNVTIVEDAADAVPSAQPQPKPDKPAKKDKEPKPPTESGEMFTRLCFVLFGHQNTTNGGLTDKQRGLLNTESKRLRDAGATHDDLGEWYKQVWRTTWPGNQAGQHPTIAQVIAGVNAWIEGGRKPPAPTASANGNGNGKADGRQSITDPAVQEGRAKAERERIRTAALLEKLEPVKAERIAK
jgi:hypothetical protein